MGNAALVPWPRRIANLLRSILAARPPLGHWEVWALAMGVQATQIVAMLILLAPGAEPAVVPGLPSFAMGLLHPALLVAIVLETVLVAAMVVLLVPLAEGRRGIQWSFPTTYVSAVACAAAPIPLLVIPELVLVQGMVPVGAWYYFVTWFAVATGPYRVGVVLPAAVWLAYGRIQRVRGKRAPAGEGLESLLVGLLLGTGVIVLPLKVLREFALEALGWTWEPGALGLRALLEWVLPMVLSAVAAYWFLRWMVVRWYGTAS